MGLAMQYRQSDRKHASQLQPLCVCHAVSPFRLAWRSITPFRLFFAPVPARCYAVSHPVLSRVFGLGMSFKARLKAIQLRRAKIAIHVFFYRRERK